jgi:membrane protein implicated in regulation of membrane protease activity
MSLLFWVVVAVVLAIVEIFTVSFFFLFFAIGATITAVVAIFTEDINLQTWIFILSSLLCLAFARPLVKKAFRAEPEKVPSNVSRVLGEAVLVLEPVTRYAGRVRVLHTGEVWSAYLDEETVKDVSELAADQEGVVCRVDGAKLVIKPVSSPAVENS